MTQENLQNQTNVKNGSNAPQRGSNPS